MYVVPVICVTPTVFSCFVLCSDVAPNSTLQFPLNPQESRSLIVKVHVLKVHAESHELQVRKCVDIYEVE